VFKCSWLALNQCATLVTEGQSGNSCWCLVGWNTLH